ncbi:NAD(P)H-dependent oxidoreductase, partial [Rhizobiaceae sp. 2RAB30]
MNVLVLYAHPVETSFNAALHRLIVERLVAKGHTVDDCDLYAEDFDPRLTRAERLVYHDVPGNTDT